MKKRNPGLVFLFTFLSGGVYFIYWIFSLVEEINYYRKQEVIKYKPLIIKFLVVFFAYMVLFFLLFDLIRLEEWSILFFISFITCFALAIYWFVLIIGTIRKIGKEVKKIQDEKNANDKISVDLLTVLMLVDFVGIVYLQYYINKLIDEHEKPVKISRKPLIISLVMLVSVLIIFSVNMVSFFKGLGIFGVGRQEVIRFDLELNKTIDEAVYFESPGEYQLWIDLDLKYTSEMLNRIDVEIRRDDMLFLNKQYSPLNPSLKMFSSEVAVGNKINQKFLGRLDKIQIKDAGTYELMIMAAFDDQLIELRKYQFYIK